MRARTKAVARMWLGVAALLWAASVAVVARVPPGPAQEPSAPLSDEELDEVGERAIGKVCTECHPFDEIVVARRTPADWTLVAAEMARKGAVATPQESAIIRGYLTRFYGLALVNSASAADLAAVLGIPPAQGEAIVTYRTGNGRFASLEALLRVPGISRERLESDPAALKFD